jgi:hypothetical protein
MASSNLAYGIFLLLVYGIWHCSVIVGTPHENLYAMVAAGEKYGKY